MPSTQLRARYRPRPPGLRSRGGRRRSSGSGTRVGSKAGASSTMRNQIRSPYGDRIWLRIVDDAPAFDPTRVPEPDDLRRPPLDRRPGGLGLYLARSCVDGMSYELVNGRNAVTLTIHCARPPSVSVPYRRGG